MYFDSCQREVRSLQTSNTVAVAPVKALCTERSMDWADKFAQLGLNCLEVTGDYDKLEFGDILPYHLILTTPEKWDSMTRKWKDHTRLVQLVKLFLIDEVSAIITIDRIIHISYHQPVMAYLLNDILFQTIHTTVIFSEGRMVTCLPVPSLTC